LKEHDKMFGHNSTQSWRALDAAHHLHPFSNAASLAHEGTRVIVRAQGPYIWDSDGNRILDGMAGLWNVNIGYGRQELADAAYKQMQELPFSRQATRLSSPFLIS
jgi:putrescine---pyruvate transaminase